MKEVKYNPHEHITIEEASRINGLGSEQILAQLSGRQYPIYQNGEGLYVDRLDLGRIMHVPMPKDNRKGVKIGRYFSREGENPYDSVGNYVTKRVEIKDFKTGKVVFSLDATFPEGWKDVSRQIVAQKYFFKPHGGEWAERIPGGRETDVRQLVERVSQFYAERGAELGYFPTEEDKQAFADELRVLQIKGMGAFNSPTYFNAGIYNSYGIAGNKGANFIRDPETGEVTKVEAGCYVYPQTHACFIKGPRDNLESILEHTVVEGAVFANGSGVGQDIGALREQGASLSGGGKASGPMSFLVVYDKGAGTIKSGGKSRRAARMTTMRGTHPDIMDFIRQKVREDHKALMLMKAGYSSGMDGEAYNTVALQNTNLSVRLNDDFFEAVENDDEVKWYSVTTGELVGKMGARRMLQEISFGSWRIGDPAIQFESRIDEFHTCPNSGRQNSSNPCSEYMWIDDTACNLASLNLVKFTDSRGNLDVEAYERACRIFLIAQDIANDAGSYPHQDIAQVSPEFRTTGLGYANLGALLMRKGLPYDSEEARAFAAAVTAIMHGAAYKTSAELAKGLESFTHYELNREPMLEVIKKHQAALDDVNWNLVEQKELESRARELWDDVIGQGERTGFRNAQVTVLAPTGTISYLMGCDTTGMEPATALVTYKNLAGGGNLKLVIDEIPNALNNLGYTPEQIRDIEEFIATNEVVVGAPHLSSGHYAIFDTAFDAAHNKTATIGRTISPEGHIRMLGAVTPFLSGAASKTNNLPNTATVKDIFDAYLLGYRVGAKAVSVFRDKSKPTSVLVLDQNESFVDLRRGEKEDLPTRRGAYEVEVKIDSTPLHVMVSEYPDGRPGQVALLSYTAGSTLGALLRSHGISASKALQRGVRLDDVVSAWRGEEFRPNGLVQGHPFIKTALSPLDFAYKFLLLEYMGNTDVADVKEVKTEDLRGYQNGAIEHYERAGLDDWNFDDVINDPKWGGFVEEKDGVKKPKKEQKEGTNHRGNLCTDCGNILIQVKANCYECHNCGNSSGGCGV